MKAYIRLTALGLVMLHCLDGRADPLHASRNLPFSSPTTRQVVQQQKEPTPAHPWYKVSDLALPHLRSLALNDREQAIGPQPGYGGGYPSFFWDNGKVTSLVVNKYPLTMALALNHGACTEQ